MGDTGFSIVIGVPQQLDGLRENPIEMDENSGYPYFRKTPFVGLKPWDFRSFRVACSGCWFKTSIYIHIFFKKESCENVSKMGVPRS